MLAFRRQLLGASALALVIAASLAVAARSESSSGQSGPTIGARVSAMDNYFNPRSVTIEQGEAVKWVWKGDGKHNVVFNKVPSGASKNNVRGRTKGSAVRTLNTVGTYHYECTLYDGMQGTVTVQDHR
jgi:plastocyanin